MMKAHNLPLGIPLIVLVPAMLIVLAVPARATNLATGLSEVETKPMALAPLATPRAVGNILWDTHHGIYLNYDPNGRYSTLRSLLVGKGHTIEVNDSGILNLTLENYQVIVVCLTSAWDSAYSTAEAIALKEFVAGGGGLLVMGDNSYSPNENVNTVAEIFGTTVGLTELFPSDLYITNLSNNYIFDGISEIYQRAAGELAGTRIFSDNAAWAAAGEAVAAIAGCGLGKVILLGDTNTMENAYIGTSDNQLFSERVFDWLADSSIYGNNKLGTMFWDSYSGVSWLENGREMAYKIILDQTSDIEALLSYEGSSTDIFLLDGCSNENVLDYGLSTVNYTNAPPGTYHVVVDGYQGAIGPYTLDIDVICAEPPIIDDISVDGCISERCNSDISVAATAPCGGSLTYVWTPLDGGTIVGSGTDVTFDPPDSGPHPCPYRVNVAVISDSGGLNAEATIGIQVKLAGDANGDGVVNILDKVMVRNAFGSTGYNLADVNCDNVVNILDKVIVRNQFGQSGCACSAAPCLGQSCGSYTLDCDPDVPCICFQTTEGYGVCIDDFLCGGQTCLSSADCPGGQVCITDSCCGENLCVPAVCTDGLPSSEPAAGWTGSGK